MATRKPPSKASKKSPKVNSPKQTTARAVAKTPNKIADKASMSTAAKSKPQQDKAAVDAKPEVHKTGASVLGEVVWLMSQSKTHQSVTAGELKTRLIPAINKGQVRVFQAKDKVIGAAIWAFVSDEVEQRLAQSNAQLEQQDWTSGTTVWLTDLIAPFGAEKTMLEEMKETLFPDRAIKFRGHKDGKTTVYSI
jgi:cytolysin-activating lysine-acyltransferase